VVLTLVALAALLTLRTLQLSPAYGVSPENWPGATQFVVDRSQPGDCVAFYPSDNRQAFRYYLGSAARAPHPILPSLPWTQSRSFVEDYAGLTPRRLAAVPTICRRVWLVASHEGRAGGPPISQGNYLRYLALTNGLRSEYQDVSSQSFSTENVVTVTLYSR
jgi:hypothetical protein